MPKRLLLCLVVTSGLAWCQEPEAAAAVTPAAKENPGATSINYGLGAIAPANQPYIPLTPEERWRLWAKNNFVNPRSYARAFVFSIRQHQNNSPPEWGTGAEGYFKRAGSRYARLTLSSSIHHGVAGMLGHDPRYISCRDCKGVGRRLWHSFVYEFMTYNNAGRPVVNVGALAGQFGSEAIASTWIPNRTVGVQLRKGLIEQVSIGWLSNVAKEFAPEIKRAFKRKK